MTMIELTRRRLYSPPGTTWVQVTTWAVIGAIGFLVPLVVNVYYAQVLVRGLVFGLLALSIGWLLRQTGFLSFGHAAFFGLGAYAAALYNLHVTSSPLEILLLSLGTVGVFALLVGLVLVRVSGIAFTMLTLSVAQLLWLFVTLNRDLTRGHDGMIAFFQGSLLGIDASMLTDPKTAWPLAWGSVIIVIAILWAVSRSTYGRRLASIRENEDRFRFSGSQTYLPKVGALGISGVVAGLAGILSAFTLGLVSPESLHWTTSGNALIYAVIGGPGTLVGPVAGAGFFVFLQSLLSGGFHYQAIIGVTLIVFVVVARGGISALVARGYRAIGRRLRSGGGDDA